MEIIVFIIMDLSYIYKYYILYMYSRTEKYAYFDIVVECILSGMKSKMHHVMRISKC